MIGLRLAERRLVPDRLIRVGIRRMLRERLRQIHAGDFAFDRELREGPLALVPTKPNEQHYELPPEFFEPILGPWMKYSCALWDDPGIDLEAAEAAMLRLTCQRAGIRDGMRILELGCGWGSLSCWMASRYPQAEILAVSNSKLQREFIERRVRRLALPNLRVETHDMNSFSPGARFDRIVSVEMFEHMRNYQELLRRIASWLEADGRLFVHVFAHAEKTYPYEAERDGDWMAEHFFTGGMMPSDRLLFEFPQILRVECHWRLSGEHYRRTCEAWLARLDRNASSLRPVLERAYGSGNARLWLQRWRLFFLACAELFGYRGGDEWGVSHYLMRHPEDSGREVRAR